MIAVQA